MEIAIAMMLGLFATENKEFFDTVTEQRAQGYEWVQFENCRSPEAVPNLPMVTGTGEELVCYKLVK